MANHNANAAPVTDVAIIDYFLTNPMGEVSLLHRFLGAALAARGRVTPVLPIGADRGPVGPVVHPTAPSTTGVVHAFAPGEVALPALQPPIIRRRRRRTQATAGAPAGPGTATVAVEMAATGAVGEVEGLDADPGLPPEEMGG